MDFFSFFRRKKAVSTDVVNTSDSKEDIMKMMMGSVSQKAPSEHFASGSVFDIVRKNHEQFVQIVNSGDVGDLMRFFANAYVAFVNQPQMVGFAPSMVDIRRNDTNPGMWNVDIMTLSSGEKVALCFMPVNSDVYRARIIGIVLCADGDRYYYCMLKKDENTPSDVMQNKATCGIEKIGSLKGLGFELMNDFVKCINNTVKQVTDKKPLFNQLSNVYCIYTSGAHVPGCEYTEISVGEFENNHYYVFSQMCDRMNAGGYIDRVPEYYVENGVVNAEKLLNFLGYRH